MAELHWGWHMPSFPVDGSSGAEFVDQIAGTLDALGDTFASVWVDDHVHPWGTFVPRETPALECATTIAYFAARYPALDFGSMVFCQSYRNPALLAKMAANLQLLTGGRYIFGIGAGWFEEEYHAYDYNFPKPAVRIAQMEETIEIAKRLWTETPASYEGKHYRIQDAYCEPKPQPLPTIMIGGGGEQLTLRIVARHADWWNLPGGTVETYAHKLEVLRRHCAEAGRDFDEIVKSISLELVAVAEDEEEAQRQADASLYNKGNAIAGTPDQVAGQLRRYIDLGVTHYMLRFADFPGTEGIKLFREEVVVRLRD
jgi:alkanesulfonate monooxygenase SsuD/methylene tetrahydromethanopterin reductase-like flavin-dependent oxidoreductase (luciferase family)